MTDGGCSVSVSSGDVIVTTQGLAPNGVRDIDPTVLLGTPDWARLQREMSDRLATPMTRVDAAPVIGYGWYAGTIGKLTGVRNDRQFTPGRRVVAVTITDGNGWLSVAVGDRKGNFLGKDAPVTMPVVTPADQEKLIDDADTLIQRIAAQLGLGGPASPSPHDS